MNRFFFSLAAGAGVLAVILLARDAFDHNFWGTVLNTFTVSLSIWNATILWPKVRG